MAEMMEENKLNEQYPRTIEVLLSRDGSAFSWLTYFTDGGGLTHASIALDPDAEFYYSFNFKGLKKEYKTSLQKRPREMKVYKIAVTEEQYQKLKSMLEDMEAHKEKYKYSSLGVTLRLFRLPGSKKDENDDRYFCSEFVARLLGESGSVPVSQDYNRTSPNDLAEDMEKSGRIISVTDESNTDSLLGVDLDPAVEKLGEKKDIVVNFMTRNLEEAEGRDDVPPVMIHIGEQTAAKSEELYRSAAAFAEKAEKLTESVPEKLAEKTGEFLQFAGNAVNGLKEKTGEIGKKAGNIAGKVKDTLAGAVDSFKKKP